jgi:hypothetical protein
MLVHTVAFVTDSICSRLLDTLATEGDAQNAPWVREMFTTVTVMYRFVPFDGL